MCISPIKAWRSKDINPSGRRSLVFDSTLSQFYGHPSNEPMEIGCGKCIECRLEKSREWSIRCVHEAQMNEFNSFATLTFNDEHLPPGGSVDVRDLQLFWKKLRKKWPNDKIRYFACGEYGDEDKRPHYHALIFGFDFYDKKFKKMHKGFKYYTSDLLDEIWGNGFCWLSDVSFNTAGYVAKYVMKKWYGEETDERYVDLDTGLIRNREFIVMSRRPGLGKSWLEKYQDDVFPAGELAFADDTGRRFISTPPKYYENEKAKEAPEAIEALKERRELIARRMKEKNSPYHRAARESLLRTRLENNEMTRRCEHEAHIYDL